MKIWDVIIVGGGPAGLFTAINIDPDKKVLIIEKNEKAGKKLLISGKGQCNITHAGSIFDFFDKYNLNGRYIKRALSLFSNEDLMKYFKGSGLNCVIRDDGKVFPHTFKATDVLNVLLDHLQELNRKVYCSLKVLDIHYDGTCYEIVTDKDKYYSTQVVIATGGITYPSLGTSGDGQRIAEKLGHQLIQMKGGLSPIKVDCLKNEDLSGIVLENAIFSLYRNDKKISSYSGDVLFTHEGLSGPGIINHSRDFKIGDDIRLDLNKSLKDLESTKSLKNSLKQFFPERLVNYLVKKIEINFNLPYTSLNLKDIKLLETNLHSLVFPIDSVGSLNDSMVTCGGVGFKSVSSKTYESRLYKGLYYAGEVLDIDGETGGYNLQASFSMGYLVAQSMNQKSK